MGEGDQTDNSCGDAQKKEPTVRECEDMAHIPSGKKEFPDLSDPKKMDQGCELPNVKGLGKVEMNGPLQDLVKLTPREENLCNMAHGAGRDEVLNTRLLDQDAKQREALIRDKDRSRIYREHDTIYKREVIQVQMYRDHCFVHNNFMKVTELLKVAVGIGIVVALCIE